MKLNISKTGSRHGVLLIECIVYISVLVILLGIGFATFYMMWNNSLGMQRMAGDVSAVLRAGEGWRADIRSATGAVRTETSGGEILLKIPRGKTEVVYRLAGDELWRQARAGQWTLVLSHVTTSSMEREAREGIAAWQWNLALDPHGTGRKKPLLFSFEAVAPAK